MSSTGGLTQEQLKRIEENKKKALAKRLGKPVQPTEQSQPNPSASGQLQNTVNSLKTSSSSSVKYGNQSRTSNFNQSNASNVSQSKASNVGQSKASNISQSATQHKPCNEAKFNNKSENAIQLTVNTTLKIGDKVKESLHNKVVISNVKAGLNINTSVQSDTGVSTNSFDNKVNQPKTICNNSKSETKATVSVNYDLIEANRLKALAKRAERLKKSPIKVGNQGLNNTQNISNVQTNSLDLNFHRQSLAHSTKSTNSFVKASHTSAASSNISAKNVSPNISSKSNEVSANKPLIGSSGAHVSGPIKTSSPLTTLASSYTCKPASTVSVNSTSSSSGNSKHSTLVNSNSSAVFSKTSADAGIPSNPFVQSLEAGQSPWNAFDGVKSAPVKGSCVLISRDRFEVKVGFSEPLIQLFKSMNTKLYDAQSKKWSFHLSEYNRFMTSAQVLKSAVDLEPLPKAIQQVFISAKKGSNSRDIPHVDLSRVESSLVNSLMSFQRTGVSYGVSKNGRVLIADDMGLGKTIQAICLSCYYRDEWPLLVVTPSSVRFDWAKQFERWVPSIDQQCINTVVAGNQNCTSGLINILSYDIMARKAEALRKKHFQVIIMDECHLLKNNKTARCKSALPLLQSARRVILLSGTPALSRPSELFTQISAVCPFLFKFHDFGVRYCEGKQSQWGWDYTGSSNMTELQILLEEKVMIRRLKKDVLTELPDKIRQVVLLDPASVKITKDLKTASKVLTDAHKKKTEERGPLLEFFHKSGMAKIKAIKTYIEDLLEGDKKFLIFAHHGDVLDAIETVVKDKLEDNYMRIDGRTSSEQRSISCERFQVRDSMRVAVLSITAANAGLNLSSANLVVFAELFWNPGILQQAEDRVHRIGQQNSVVVQYLVAKGTSDDHLWPMIQKKLDVLCKAGLSKDNFSLAETTRLKDPKQEEITKFLEESFCEDPNLDDLDDTETEFKTNSSPSKVVKQQSILNYTSPQKNPTPTKPKKSGMQQQSILSYVSPQKDNPPGQSTGNKQSALFSSVSPKSNKQSALFSGVSPKSNKHSALFNGVSPKRKLSQETNNNTKANTYSRMDNSSRTDNSSKMDNSRKTETFQQGHGQSSEGHELEDDLDLFLNDIEDSDIRTNNIKADPPVKKRKIEPFKTPFIKKPPLLKGDI